MDALDKMLHADRQWKRAQRVAHYQFMFNNAPDQYAREFWEAALRALGVGQWVQSIAGIK